MSVAIISGGIGDIGSAIALELARRGADVALGDVREDAEAEPLLEELRRLGRKARYDRVDVSDSAAVREWVARVEEDLGVPDLIIPNAAIATLADTRALTPEQWDRELSINLSGAFYLAQAGALRQIEHGGAGRIVFIGSWAAHAVHVHIPTYCVAKAGLRMLCRCMAMELAPYGIRVNEVAPGKVNAGLSAKVWRDQPERRERDLEQIPVGYPTEPEEVALQVAHLCDPANRQMTGSVLLMDGGMSLLSGRGAE